MVSELGYIVTRIFRVQYEHIVLYSFAGWMCVFIPLAFLWTYVDCLLFIEVSITVMPDSYFGGAQFEYQPGLRLVMVFLSSFRQLLG